MSGDEDPGVSPLRVRRDLWRRASTDSDEFLSSDDEGGIPERKGRRLAAGAAAAAASSLVDPALRVLPPTLTFSLLGTDHSHAQAAPLPEFSDGVMRVVGDQRGRRVADLGGAAASRAGLRGIFF
jgi:hypothetical protein